MTKTATPKAELRVGAHFVAGEFGTSDPAHFPGIGALCALFLDELRARFGACTVHSGYRDATRNAKVGGAPDSRHVYDKRPLTPAVDVSFAKGTPGEWSKAARELAFAHGRGGVGTYATHLHIDLGPRRIW